MAKDVLRVAGDYAIETVSNGTITLNTGNETGSVVVTGDLTVLGNTSTVSSENLTIKVDGYYIDFVKVTKLLGAIIHNKLNFDMFADFFEIFSQIDPFLLEIFLN